MFQIELAISPNMMIRLLTTKFLQFLYYKFSQIKRYTWNVVIFFTDSKYNSDGTSRTHFYLRNPTQILNQHTAARWVAKEWQKWRLHRTPVKIFLLRFILQLRDDLYRKLSIVSPVHCHKKSKIGYWTFAIYTGIYILSNAWLTFFLLEQQL